MGSKHESNGISYRSELGVFEESVNQALVDLKANRVMERLWEHDHTIWKESPDEISNRLGWIGIAESMREEIPHLNEFVDEVRAAGLKKVLLLGMGGSSLAPEVFSKIFGTKEGYLNLEVLDSTDPAAVLAARDRHDPKDTLYIVATKSGGTVETLSFFKYFYNLALAAVGENAVGEHFIAITDPGSSLVELAAGYRFRKTFLSDPNIGGRYAALSHFGLVPAALIGVDLERLLEFDPTEMSSLGAKGGSEMGVLAMEGRDKITLIGNTQLNLIGPWVEQLIAESTGKEGKGTLPVSAEDLGSADVYGDDRFFVHLAFKGDSANETKVELLKESGHPVAFIALEDIYDLGAEFLRWELVTAVAGHYLQINPFNQPNVEAAKVLAREMAAAYHERGELPTRSPTFEAEGIEVYADVTGEDLEQIADEFFSLATPGDYIAIQAYLQPTDAIEHALQQWRIRLRDRLRLATTLGFGPRFLHSTGQLHKGDGGNGLFVQITCDDGEDADIPDRAGSSESSMSFGVLKAAQALGDRQALLDAGRRVICFHVGLDVVEGIQKLKDLY